MTGKIDGVALMREIDRSVLTWCSDHKPEDAVFHGALLDPEAPTKEELDLGWRNYYEMHGHLPKHLRDVVFRRPTWEHIPDYYGRRMARGQPATGLPFQPFEHYRYLRNRPKCVLRSHWIGLPDGGRFRTPTDPQGRLTEELGRMIYELADRYGSRGNWNGYTHIDDMKADARLALAASILKFSPLKSSNPFAYATQTMKTAMITSMRDHAKVWENERHMGDSNNFSEDGQGHLPIQHQGETFAEAAERELANGQTAFDNGK